MAQVDASKLRVHITADDWRGVFREVLETVRMTLDAHSHEIDTLRERVQRLESLPGVAEALAAQEEGEWGDK